MDSHDIHIRNLDNLFNHIRYVSSSDFDIEDIQYKSALFADLLTIDYIRFPNSKETIKASIIRMRELIKNLLTSIDEGFRISLEKIDVIYKKIEEIDKFSENNPIYVGFNDNDECKKFYKTLKKEEYTFIEAAEILNLTRQTISKYYKTGKFGFIKTEGKKITKEAIYLFYVKRHNNNKLK